MLKFPEEVVHTTFRPDIVLWSRNLKPVISTSEAHGSLEGEDRGSIGDEDVKVPRLGQHAETKVFPVEVSSLGFPSWSTWQIVRALGIKGQV